jgi:diguanylate cyclase (GGDEF)-like protein
MLTMTKPGFRTGKPGERRSSAAGEEEGSAGRPFSQAQILDLMKIEFARARRYGFAVACILIQVNRLVALTDVHGTPLREGVRRELCRLVREKTRSSDYLGTFGDSGYLVILPHADADRAEAVAARILKDFGALAVEAEGTPLHLCLSLGVAASEDQETLFFDTLVSQAEVALQWAMDAEGDQVMVFDKSRYLKSEDQPDEESSI